MTSEEKRKKIKQIIKSGALADRIFTLILSKTGYCDHYLSHQLFHYKTYYRIRKRYEKYIEKLNYPIISSTRMECIWFCWLQGEEHMPEISRLCLKTIEYYCKDKQIIFIDEKNFDKYVTLPDFIIKKWRDGYIPAAHFSDILRCELLIEHGGIWIDSTVYLTGNLPEYITDSDFFLYRNGWLDNEMINMASWIISSHPNNKLLIETRNLLYKYWSKNTALREYFLFHLMFRLVTEKYKEDWNKIPYYNHIDQHILQKEILNKYNEKRINQITDLSTVHKLTNKISTEIPKDSIYTHLNEIYKQH